MPTPQEKDEPPGAKAGTDWSAFVLAAGSLVLISGFVFSLWRIAPPPPPDLGANAHVLPVPLEIPDFELVDHRGGVFDRAALEGGWSLLFFGYTYCPDICPVTLQKLAPVLDLLGPDARLQAVFVSVDPARDDPARLAEYVAFFHPALIGASGEMAEIEKLTRAIGVYHEKSELPGTGDGYLVDHSSSLFLVGPSARLRAIFHEPEDPQSFVDLLDRAAALADELVIEGAWIRLPPPGANTAGYMTLVNDGDAPVRLTGVASDSVERVELHESAVEGGVARMRHVDSIEIPAHGRLTLAPRGLHLMLIRPGTLVEGGTVRLVLEFDGRAAQTVEVPVRREPAKP